MPRQLDTGRLRNLVSGPGVDTRYNLVLAVVDKVIVDPQEGVFCDISFLPQEQPETAFLGVPYAGDGFGFYFPVEEDDIVLVGVPDGDPGAGPVIVSRMWSAADKPFAELQGVADTDNPGQYKPSSDVVLKTKSGVNCKTLVSGGGNAEISAAGSGIVKLQDGSQSFVRGDEFDARLDTFVTAVQSLTSAISTLATAVQTYGTATAGTDPAHLAASTVLTTAITTTFASAVATFNTAANDFKASSSSWLSTKVKGQ
jgi:hypothetical protein